MIKINKVSKTYDNRKILKDFSLEVPSGKVFGFLGPNGAGKTTTIKMITGIEKIDSGEIIVDEMNIKRNPIDAKAKIAYVSDEPTFYEYMTGIDYLNFISDIFDLSPEHRKESINYYSDLFELSDSLNQLISRYSHGMKQKLALIAAFIHSPKIIVLDEPMVGLDAKTVKILKNTLKEYAKNGNTVFYSTHVMDVAERFCDNFAIINKGKLLFTGSFEELQELAGKKDSSLEDLFLELTEVSE